MQSHDLTAVEEQENVRDIEYAVEILHKIRKNYVDEDVHNAVIELNVASVRSCFELMLSAMETFGGYNVAAIEDMHGAMSCMLNGPLSVPVAQMQH